MNSIILERLREEYLEAVVILDHLCFGGLWTLAGYQRELTSPNSELLVLRSPVSQNTTSGSLNKTQDLIGIGCFWAILDEAHITILGIHPDYRSQGLGRLLLVALLQTAIERKMERATLEVRASNQIALSIYEEFGFQVAGIRRKYYQNPPEDALILWRSGLQTENFTQELHDWLENRQNLLAAVDNVGHTTLVSWQLQDRESLLSE